MNPVKVVPEWYKNYRFVLIESMDDLRESFREVEGKKYFISFDTETSGLDPESSSIVGFSYCIDGKSAYYVAVDHFISDYNLGEESLDFIYDKMCNASRVIMYNARFDMRMMEYWGYNADIHKDRFKYIKYDMSKVVIFDVSNSCWLADTNMKFPSLKECALRFLGYKMQSFAEVSDGVENFYYIDPKDCYFYASSDALCTFLLVGVTIKYFTESGYAGKMDNLVLYPLMHYEQEKIYLDSVVLDNLRNKCRVRLDSLEREIYNEVGYVFKLNSPAQVSDAFSRLGIDTGSRTKTGYMKTGIDILGELPEDVRLKNPALSKFIEYKSLFKFLSSYVEVLYNISIDKGYSRCSYKTQQVPTGRLASGKDSKNRFFSEFNIQSSPKPHPMFYYVLDEGDRSIYSKKDNIIMGYKFIPVVYDESGKEIKGNTLYDNYLGVVEGANPDDNVRAAFIPKSKRDDTDDEWVFCSIDFSGQELRLAANFSREPVWVNAFKSGEDIHKQTAYSIWGEERYDKEKRKMAKGANFSVIYGAQSVSFVGTGKTNERPDGMSLVEAEEFFNNYRNGLPTLFSYQERLVMSCKRRGVVSTFFGRPRRVKYYFENRQAGFGSRSILNSPIQGTAGDVLKVVMIKLWNKVLNNPEYMDDVMFKSTVHDEINYGIRASRLNEIGRVLENTMIFTVPEWEVPLTVEVSFGWSWGTLFSFVWNDEKGHYEPKREWV